MFYIYSKIVIHVLIFLNFFEKLRERDFDQVITFLEEFRTDNFVYLAYFAVFLPRNKNFAFAMVAEKREICCFFFTGSVYPRFWSEVEILIYPWMSDPVCTFLFNNGCTRHHVTSSLWAHMTTT